jgi:hypothetical protein
MYGKVFNTIYDGTLYGHWEAIVTMQQLIVLASPDGVVDMTPQAIAARTSIPVDIIAKGLEFLAQPDPHTRTPGEEGRRIVLIDDHRPWGWRLVNHAKYRGLRDLEQKRQADRERIAEKRRKNSNVAIASRRVANVAHSDSDTDSEARKSKAIAPSAPLLDAGEHGRNGHDLLDHRLVRSRAKPPGSAGEASLIADLVLKGRARLFARARVGQR